MNSEDHNTETAVPRNSRLLLRVLGIGLILISVIVAIYLIVGYFAYQSGQELRVEAVETQRSQQLVHQLDLAQEDISVGSYDLALRRLNWVLERFPDNVEAVALQQQAEAALKTALTPDAPPTATPLPEPTPNLTDLDDPQATLASLQRMAERQQWEDLVAAAVSFQRQFPSYERLETDRLLYAANLNLGLQLIKGENIELGLNYLSQAEKLGDLPQEALDYWLWAELYLQGLAYYGVNWGVASSNFRDLCLSAPFYQGSCDKLFTSLWAYADQFAVAQDWCPAADFYREARQYGSDSELTTKLNTAIEGCAAATPTPKPIISDTLTISGTVPLVTITP